MAVSDLVDRGERGVLCELFGMGQGCRGSVGKIMMTRDEMGEG